MRLPDLEAWAIFATVVEHRSFTAAANALGLSKASVSKAVTRLETHLGLALFHRTSRRLSLSQAGSVLAEHAQRILADAHQAEEAARSEAALPAGRIRMAAPMSFGEVHVAPLIAQFLADYPAIEIDLHLSDDQVDVVADGFDLALRIAGLADSALKVRILGTVAMHVVGAPAYFAAHGYPRHPQELAQHRCLGYAYATQPNPWRFTRPDGTEIMVRPQGPLRCTSGTAMLPAVRAGLGLAILPDFIVASDLARGDLVSILADWQLAPRNVHLLMPPAGFRPNRVRLLVDFLDSQLRR